MARGGGCVMGWLQISFPIPHFAQIPEDGVVGGGGGRKGGLFYRL